MFDVQVRAALPTERLAIDAVVVGTMFIAYARGERRYRKREETR